MVWEMPVETRTLPGAILNDRGGQELGSGWSIVIYESAGKWQPLEEWRGEMIVADEEQRKAIAAAVGTVLYVQFQPYAAEDEAWHGPALVELVDAEHDPYNRRVRFRSAGTLIRSERPEPVAAEAS
jgi:hypothetical protein